MTKLAIALLATLPLVADTITTGTPYILATNPVESVSQTPDGFLFTATGLNLNAAAQDIEIVEQITIPTPGLYTLSADLSLMDFASVCNPQPRCGGSSADWTATYTLGPDHVSLSNPISWVWDGTTYWDHDFGAVVTGSDTEQFAAGTYNIVGMIHGTQGALGEGLLDVKSRVSVVDPPVATPEPEAWWLAMLLPLYWAVRRKLAGQ